MNAADKLDLRRRAHYVLRAPIPAVVSQGDARVAAEYRGLAGVVTAFVERGSHADRAQLALARLEGMQCVRGAADGGTRASGAARSATPPSNTGVNEGRQWLLGSGL